MKINDIEKFAQNIESKMFFDYDVKHLNWFNIGGKTQIFFKPESLRDLKEFLKLYKKRGKIFILGAGSNILFSDKLFEGVVIKLGKNFNKISKLAEDKIIAGSIVIDKNLSEFAKENAISGFEFLSCIPGTVGGGIRMNSGCYGSEFKDIVLSVQAVDYNGNIITIPSKKIKFNYRESDLPNDLVFLSASFLGKKSNTQDIYNKIEKLKKEKEISQPSKIKTGGSTFKNPINHTKHKVWELIKQSVPEHTKFGDAVISSHHANFFVNEKDAKFQDMMMLIDYVKDKVKQKFKINLDLEIKIIK